MTADSPETTDPILGRCAFCGSDALVEPIFQVHGDDPDDMRLTDDCMIRCTEPSCRTEGKIWPTEAEAVAAWNRRPT